MTGVRVTGTTTGRGERTRKRTRYFNENDPAPAINFSEINKTCRRHLDSAKLIQTNMHIRGKEKVTIIIEQQWGGRRKSI